MDTLRRALTLAALAAATLTPRIGVAAPAAPELIAAPEIGPNASEPGAAPIAPPVSPSPPADSPVASNVAQSETPPPRAPDASEGRKAPSRFKIGADYTLYLPTDGHTRDRFDGSWSSVSLGLGGVGLSGSHTVVAPEFNFIYQSKGDNHVLMVPLGASYRTYWDTKGSAKPYAGVSGGVLIVDLRSKQDDISGTRAGGYGSVFAGLSLTDDFFVETRYYAAGKVRSFDLSGLSLSTGVRF